MYFSPHSLCIYVVLYNIHIYTHEIYIYCVHNAHSVIHIYMYSDKFCIEQEMNSHLEKSETQ